MMWTCLGDMGKGTGSGHGAGEGAGGYKGKSERFFIPAMPMPAAIICCILNFLIPGLGKVASGPRFYKPF